MYLSINQHDQFRTLVMGFEIPYRKYISETILSNYTSEDNFETALLKKKETLQASDPFFLRNILPKTVKSKKIEKIYNMFKEAIATTDIIAVDQEMPVVGVLNLVTFALLDDFQDLYNTFTDYSAFCDLSEKYRYARNKLDHPGSRTLEDAHLVPVLSFIKDICIFLDDRYFVQKKKEDILSEVAILQKRKIKIPIEKNNLTETPYPDSQIVCRETEIKELKSFVYGNPGDLRKQHSRCIYGYGGVGKTALVIETIKQIIQDIIDREVVNDYSPKYLIFFSAKKRKLQIAEETGCIIEQQIKLHFETADELIDLIHTALGLKSFKNFHDEGLIIIDNLESLSQKDRKRVKKFIETQTPTEMQFIITSRNSEEFESNTKLFGFDSESGNEFVYEYIEQNALDLQLTKDEIKDLLEISKGNTLVLVLCLRRLSQKLIDISSLKLDFSHINIWTRLHNSISNLAPNAYESISDFMFKDTFEQIESVFNDIDLFYKILKIFAIMPSEGIDLSTICLLASVSYPNVEATVNILCNYLIVERSGNSYTLNQFAESYIIQRFIPDEETYYKLSSEIQSRQCEIKNALDKLEEDMKGNTYLKQIMNDWHIITPSDKISAAKMYTLYGQAKQECDHGGKYKVNALIEDIICKSTENEKVTAHPYIKFQKARILQMIDNYEILSESHIDEIRKSYRDAIYVIKTVEQYSAIQNTKSYASLLWLFGQYLADNREKSEAIRFLEESKISFEDQNIRDKEYYQSITLLGHQYLYYYLDDRANRVGYLRRARVISRQLQSNYEYLGKARGHANSLKYKLKEFGE